MVNGQKGLTILWCILLLLFFRSSKDVQASSILAYIYMGLHGGYGVVWIIKDYCVPDARFRAVVSKTTALGNL